MDITLPLIRKDTVFHVGHLAPDAPRGDSSLEAFCLSVSDCPEDWRTIARLGNAPTWRLHRRESFWLDFLAMGPSDTAALEAWAIAHGYGTRQRLWRAWSEDEDGTPRYMGFLCMAKALKEIEDPGEPDGPGPDGCHIDFIDALVLTETALSALERFDDPTQGLDGAALLYLRDVAAPDNPAIAGIWWDERHDPAILSCPRGGLLPERLEDFSARPA